MSLCSGQIPNDCKSGNVVPLHKSGSVNYILNYRPMSLCSITCKTLEKIVKNKLCQHICTHGLQSPTQHGFWEKRSRVTQVSTLFHHWSETLDNPPRIDTIFLAWSRVFDKVDHQLLLQKLHKFGVCGNTLQWMSCCYLTNRRQRVTFKGPCSSWERVRSGVSQGPIILFDWLVFDLPFCVQSHLPQYADDTVLYCIINSPADEIILQNDLDMSRLVHSNKMKLNNTKYNTMHITRSKSPILKMYHINDSVLEVVSSYKYLCFLI